ncbi:MAG TPA: diguanylate cyclase [Ureibacillus sp.]|nr:diguanylate cyclase [Ureibacillus sp.]
MFSINYEALFEQNTDAIMIVNQEGFVVEANSAFFDLSRFEWKDVQNKNYENFFHYEHDDEELTACDQRAKFICKDGKSVPILVRKVSGDNCFFVVIKDMRALYAVAENYLQSELRYRIIAEHIQDVLILMDEQKNYLYVSPSALDMFRFDYRNLNNRSAFFNIHPDDVEQLEMIYEKAIVEGNSFTVKVKAWHEEKQWVWTELKGQPMYENGQFQHMLLVARDISSQHKYEEMLLQHAYSDALTNLPNRRKLNERLKEAKAALNEHAYFAVMLMDIDNFKHINDYYGHEIGDHVLVEYGQRVSAILEQKGIVGRYGGDEFMIVMPYQTQQEVEVIAKRIVAEIQRPIEIQQTILSITTSIGVAFVEEDVAIHKMVKCADKALYKVKQQGRNGCYIAGMKKTHYNYHDEPHLSY